MVGIVRESTVHGLIDNLYEAGMAFERWPAAMARMADAFGARDAALGTIGAPGLSWMCAPRTDPDYLRIYPDNFHARNDVWHRVIGKGVGAVATGEMVIERREFRRSVYYNEWAKPQGYHTVIGSLIDAERHWRTVLMLPGREPYDRDAVRLFGILAPHIRRAVQISQTLARTNQEHESLGENVESIAVAAMTVDVNARIVSMNTAAECLLSANRGLCVAGHRLETSGPDTTAVLQGAITRCAKGLALDRGTVLDIPHAAGALKLSVIPLKQPGFKPTIGRAVALILDVRDVEAPNAMPKLRARYGLTEAEARFAAEIVKGDGKRAAAERCGISYSTARSHLSRIFEKTGVHRQAALVRLARATSAGWDAPTDGGALGE